MDELIARKLALGSFLALLLPACGSGGGGGANPSAPTVIETYPLALETHAHPNDPIYVRFNEAMDPATLTTATFTLETSGGAPIAGTVTTGADSATFDFPGRLLMGGSFIARISGSVTDLAGNALGVEHSWTFTVTPAWHVDVQAAVNGDGRSWEQPVAFVHQLTDFTAGDEFRLADGSQGGHTSGILQLNQTWKGGYAGQGAPDPDARTLGSTRLVSSTYPIAVPDGATLSGFTMQDAITATSGGALLISAATGVLIEDCTFQNNQAVFGGAVVCENGGVVFRRCVFVNNRATTAAGAVKVYNSAATFERCRFTANRADTAGGALECTLSAMTLVNCILDGNRCDLDQGTVIFFTGAELTLIHCTVTGNRRTNGASATSIHMPGPGTCVAQYSIAWGNPSGDFSAWVASTSSHVGGADPLFVSPGSWNTMGTPSLLDDVWVPGDYHLQAGSIDRNAASPIPGDPTVDYDGLPRPRETLSDFGAYEYQP